MLISRKSTYPFCSTLTFFISLCISSATIHAEEDLFEPNNTLENATPIFVQDVESQSHQFISADDEDWLVFYAEAETDYFIEIPTNSVSKDINPVIDIYNSNGEKIHSNGVGGFEGEGELLLWHSPSEGFYYLRISNFLNNNQSTENNYQIRVYFEVGPDLGTIRGTITDQCSGEIINGADIINEIKSTFTYKTGKYNMPINPGEYNQTVSASHYITKSRNVSIEARELVIEDFELQPTTGCDNANIAASYNDTTGLVTIFDLLAYGQHYKIELQDQGDFIFGVSSIEELESPIIDSPATYDEQPLKLIIPNLQAFGVSFSVTLVNTGDFLFAVESIQ